MSNGFDLAEAALMILNALGCLALVVLNEDVAVAAGAILCACALGMAWAWQR